ncbi:hypothetical protein K504DRAFT_472246 [Pleomassaria siparia CBS 279.74]|uniref:LYC1 C-terminal domain-containing protein n=1 Tax=Pleomassaria siparia CBS 279.74 TaxID=1314801 RepID=A0A6G1JW78_9PLEO|nr:hypothetical protein K504DRAFT_472246 [Pleomassaria siparia CBS 279.74]
MGSAPNLPKGDSPTLALVHPTQEELLIQWNLNGAEWRGPLPLQSYLRREEVLSSQALTQNGGITYWILIDTSAKENPLDPQSSVRLPLASCETYRKKALVFRDGKVQETITHGIGSVFCAHHLRKRGYAQRMMQEVGKALKKHQVKDGEECLFSILFSDIGKKFYAEHGWEPFQSSHVSLPPAQRATDESLPTVRPLYAGDLEALCKIDEALIRKSLESRTKDSNIAVALIPDIETIQWHHAREDFVGQELHGRVPEVKGAIVGSEEGKRVWCYWTRMWYNEDPTQAKGNTLHILRLVIEDEGSSSWEGSGLKASSATDHKHDAAIAALLALAQQEAVQWKMQDVEAWNPSASTLAAAKILDPSAKIIDRDVESIASLCWYPPHQGRVTETIDWVGNEKYGWN